eukprot:TRINITY_DN22427_c0_g1_i2.p1 TRINITY_DN22427_c0_g1~~TRINITY_DN22427_c0_g1_i2.p1  ORF type:complete len:271 (+),score=42.71 TRINITY_DN22427_c0_g1_i2:134-946(+)
MIRRPPRSTLSSSSAASDVYKRQVSTQSTGVRTAINGHDPRLRYMRPAPRFRSGSSSTRRTAHSSFASLTPRAPNPSGPPRTGTILNQALRTNPGDGGQHTWAVGAVRSRRREREMEERVEDRVKDAMARDCSEKHLFRRVFGGLRQYCLAEGSKQNRIASQSFHKQLFRKVFDRLRPNQSGVSTSDPEIRFLRTLGWSPEGECADLDGSPLTEDEIAGFNEIVKQSNMVTCKRRAKANMKLQPHELSDMSSSCTSESDESDLNDLPLLF